jgi:hypothetical protein
MSATTDTRPAGAGKRGRVGDLVELAVLWLDTVLLAVLELFYLPLRFDGSWLPAAGSMPFPVSALLAAVTMPLLVKRASTLFPDSLLGLSPVLLWLVVIVIIGFFGPGGDIGLLPDWRALLLLGLGLLPTAVVVGATMGRGRAKP